MKFISLRLLAIYGLAGVSGIVLLYTSQNVQKSEDRLAVIEANAESEAESLRVLKAEWAYLNSPARLEDLAQEFLQMEPAGPGDVMSAPSLLPDVRHYEDVITEVPEQPLLHDASTATEPVEAPTEIKPTRKPVPPVRKKANKEKSFDDLIGELGGDE